MSKYRRISSNIEIKEKKKQKNSNQNAVDTKSLMEKLGIKLINNDVKTNKKYSLYLKQKKKDNNYNSAITLGNESKNDGRSIKSKSLQKRNRNDTVNIKKKNISTSYEKRTIKNDKNNKNFENRNISEIKNINNKNKERDKNIKIKKNIKEINVKNENNDNYPRKRTVKIKKETKCPNTSAKTNKVTSKIKKEVKVLQNKRNKDLDDIKRASTTKIKKNTTSNDINNAFSIKFSTKIEDFKVKENEEMISPKKIKIKKSVEKKIKLKFNLEIKDKSKEIENKSEKSEKQKKFRKNKAISVDKIISDKIFDFKSKKLSNKSNNNNNNNINNIKRKINHKKNKSFDSNKSESNSKNSNNKNDIISSDNKNNTSESESESSSESDSENSSISDNNKINTVPNKDAIKRSNARHLTDMVSQNLEKNEENAKNEKYEKIQEEKAVRRSNKKKLTVINSQNGNDKDIIRSEKRKLTEIPKSNEESDKKLGGKYLGRRTMENPLVREKLDLLMNDMVLKQNGGNQLFLKNYQKGKTYKKEIELFINNQIVKKTIKINSCTKAGCSAPGVVKTNQDAYFIKENFLKNNNNIFLGVCDGHGERGEMVSRYVSSKLPEYIKDLNTENITNIFKRINNEVYNNKSMDSNMSGTTVVSLFLTSDKIITLNIGDSRAALFKYENGLYYCKNLTRDHKPSEPDENKRIISNNGRIKKCYDQELKKYLGPDRVWLKNKEEPGLAMTRSIGDRIAHSVGVSDEPEFKNFTYDGNEKFIIIASDGIWEYLHGDDCIKIVRPFYEEGKDSEEAALALVKEAFRKWKRKEIAIDDITAIVVFFVD